MSLKPQPIGPLIAMTQKVEGMGGADFHPDYGAGRLDLWRLLK